MIASYRPVLLAIGAALCGAALFQALGVPAGALVGSTVTVTALSAAGFRLAVPARLRNLGFTAIGVTLGAGVTTHFFSDLMRFPVSLAALTVTMIAVLVISSNVLKRFFGVPAATAVLATSPGALSYSLSLAAERPWAKIDVSFVMVLQSLRLLIITVALPPLVALIDMGLGGEGVALTAAETLDFPTSILLIAIATVGGYLFERLRMPAAFLLAGVFVSGLGHGVGWLEGRPSQILTFIGFSLAGAVIGARFSSISRSELRRMFVAGLVVTTLAMIISGIISAGVAQLLDLPFGQVWVSFAPGGVEGMSAMALSLGYDPTYVATHHIFRLLLLILILPVFARTKKPSD
ncbi:AbrB family transcriptional regulator [Pseudohoeflea suaedae]|uniref:AbrB family transcriptional regulator n=1 Tax=Pseudohoeflea suaedae TaxID=877384 RepID=A0A4R5PLP2_9HYPH|nr:AbrB family transcriptional regulator [Pseudohoeflea suaedae]TDH36268.1 AbrB family transcriptional regulator [Pseudohoeflea suaedae]